MHPPRHIYSSTLSRRERSWGRHRHRSGTLAARVLLVTLIATLVTVTALRLPL